MNENKILFIIFLIIFHLFVSQILNAQVLYIYQKDNISSQYKLKLTTNYKDSVELNLKLEHFNYKNITNGYLMAGYDSINTDSIKTTAYNTLGDNYKCKELNILTEDSIILYKYKFKNNIFKYDKLFKKLNTIILHYANHSYPFASIKLNKINISKDSISANYFLTKGSKYNFDTIIIHGKPKIKQYYIEKTLGIRKNDEFSINKIYNISKRLNNIFFIEQTEKHQLAFDERNVSILLYLKDKKHGVFNGIIGFMPNKQNKDKLLITGDIKLELLNTLGYGENFDFYWQKFENLSQNLKIQASMPYVFKTDFGLGFNLNIDKKDTSYINTDINARILIGNNILTGFEMFYNKKFSYSLQTNTNILHINNYNTNLYGLTYRFINTDNIINPHKGLNLKLLASIGSKTIKNNNIEDKKDSTYLHTKSYIDINYFIKLNHYLSIKLRNNSLITYSRNLLDNELEKIGGILTIRGFDELSLLCTSYSVTNLELRYIFEANSALYIFSDYAYFEKRKTMFPEYNNALGIGVGLDLKTKAGIFTLVYAVGKLNKNPIDFSSSKIHIGYKNIF